MVCQNVQFEKKVLLFVGRATKKFLLDSDSKPTYIKLNCIKLHQPGCTRYMITVFLIDDIIAMILNVSYAAVVNGSSRIIIRLKKKSFLN